MATHEVVILKEKDVHFSKTYTVSSLCCFKYFPGHILKVVFPEICNVQLRKKMKLVSVLSAGKVVKSLRWDKQIRVTITKDFRNLGRDRSLSDDTPCIDDRPAQRMFTCVVCQQAFLHASDCMQHVYTHAQKMSSFGPNINASAQEEHTRTQEYMVEKAKLENVESSRQRIESGSHPKQEWGKDKGLEMIGIFAGVKNENTTESGESSMYETDDNDASLPEKKPAGLEKDDHRPEDSADALLHHCVECKVSFPKRSSLRRHMKVHKKPRKKYDCEFCGKNFPRSGDLLRHRRIHTGEKPFMCSVCNLFFAQASCLAIHKRTHTGERPHKCDVCSASFSELGTLKRHRRIHSDERPYVCEDCGKAFKLSNHLVEHRRLHTGERPYVCEFCGAGFAQSNGLKSHAKQHSLDRPNQCNICFKAFSHPKYLELHKRTHDGERPYECDQCDRTFRTACNLGAHKKLKHESVNPAGLKLFTCDECGATFSQACNLGIHKKKKHTDGLPSGEKNFICEICDARFYEACNLGAHKKIKHTEESEIGQNVFECDLCGAKFYRACNLAGHKKRKHAVKETDDHICKLCNSRFSSLANLETHQSRAHSEPEPRTCHVCGLMVPNIASFMKHLESHAEERFSHDTFSSHSQT